MKKIIYIVVFMSICGVSFAGVFDDVKSYFGGNLNDYKVSFEKSIDNYNKSQETSKEKLSDGISYFKEALENAKLKNPDFAALHDKWTDVTNSVNNVESNFKREVKKAGSLFEEYDRLTKSMSDKVQRDQIQAKVDSKRNEWTKHFLMTKDTLNKLRVRTSSVADTITGLEVVFSLAEVDTLIKNLDGINIEVDEILKRLDSLSEEATKMLKTNMDL